jgi:peptidoglycan/xylan/chitin deacetylase (PgdA/CDA1 family)
VHGLAEGPHVPTIAEVGCDRETVRARSDNRQVQTLGHSLRAPRTSPLRYPIKAALTLARSAAWRARSRDASGGDGLRILFYHRVADDRDDLAVPVRRFREQMAYLAAEGYMVLDVCQIGALLAAGELPERTIGLSFDDGCRDVAENAAPVLAEHSFRATVFVATGVAAGRASFTWYSRQPPVLGWNEIVALDSAGTLEFEAHSITHPNLRAVDDERAALEIEGSKAELEEHLGRAVTAFSYPAGLFGERERRIVAQAGYELAVSCEPGVNLPTTDRLALRRRQIDARDRLLDFRAKVGGGHDTPLPLRGLDRRLRYGDGRGRPLAASARR